MDDEYSYHALSCGNKEQALLVTEWLQAQLEQGNDVSIGALMAQFPFVELVEREDVPQELREMAEQAIFMHQQEIAVERKMVFFNKLGSLMFGFGSTAVVMLHRYWLYAHVEPALWLVQSWWLFPLWIGALGLSVWLWPKEQ